MSSCFVLGSKPNFGQIRVKNYYWKRINMEMEKKKTLLRFTVRFVGNTYSGLDLVLGGVLKTGDPITRGTMNRSLRVSTIMSML